MRIFIFIATLLFNGCSMMLTPEQYALDQYSKNIGQNYSNLINDVNSANFVKVNGELEKLEDEYLSKPESYEGERKLYISYFLISQEKNVTKEKIDKWIAATPENYVPYLVKAMVYNNLAYNARGSKYINETTDSAIKRMSEYHNIAEDNIHKSLSLYKDSIFAYSTLIAIKKAYVNSENDVLAAYEKALEVNPYSFEIRWAMLDYYLPQWNGEGNLNKLNKIAEDAHKYSSKNPSLKILMGRQYAWLGDRAQSEGRFNDALNYFDKALENGEIYYYRKRHADCLYKLGRYSESLREYKMASSMAPYQTDPYVMELTIKRLLGVSL